ncbi:hypothetical protein ACLB2K_030919 [Fragaria x ananassa]
MSLDSNSIRVCDFGATTSLIKTIDFQPPERDAEQLIYGRYLVESQGELLNVEKLKNPISGQFYYDIHKLNFTPNYKVECLKVEGLQERALVLSAYRSASISLSTLDIPELEANSIYVAEDKHFWPHGGLLEMYLEVEAYSLENKVSYDIIDMLVLNSRLSEGTQRGRTQRRSETAALAKIAYD